MTRLWMILWLCSCAGPTAHLAATSTSPRNPDAVATKRPAAAQGLAPDDPLVCDLPATPPCPKADQAPAHHDHGAM